MSKPIDDIPQYNVTLTQVQMEWLTNRSKILECIAPTVGYIPNGEFTLQDYAIIWDLLKSKL